MLWRYREVGDAPNYLVSAIGIAAGSAYTGTITPGDIDVLSSYLPPGHTFTLSVVGTGALSNGIADTTLRLWSPSGALVASNADGGPGLFSTITYTSAEAGYHFIEITGANASQSGEYTLSLEIGSRPVFHPDMAAGALYRSDRAWTDQPGVGANVTWAVRQSGPATDAQGAAAPFFQLSAAQAAATAAAFSQYAEVCGLTFTQVAPGGTSNDATMLFGGYSSTTDGASAYAYLPGNAWSGSVAGDVWINNNSVSTTSLPPGGGSFFTLLHEIGHAVGLSHPGDYNAAPGVPITYGAHAQFVEDSHQYTVMSYFDESNTASGANYSTHPDGLMLFDILALQQLYGANHATRAGNTVYGFNSSLPGTIYDFATNTVPAFSLWDGGGVDTLDLSGWSMSQQIKLGEGQFSNIGGRASNLSIAYGAVIENVIGGSGLDQIVGNAASNVVRGRGGNDVFDGMAGVDYAVFSGNRSAYTISRSGIDAGTVTGPDGSDLLMRVEWLVFDDGVFNWYGQAPRTKPVDIDGDGTSDVLFRHGNGLVASWQMKGGDIGLASALKTMPAGFAAADPTGDFNGDRISDVLWRHAEGGVVSWQMSNGQVGVERWLGAMDPSWTAVDTGDFNADGRHDILWRHSSGAVASWQMDGGVVQTARGLGQLDPGRSVLGAGDVTGDGDADVLFRLADGFVGLWDMQGGAVAAERGLAAMDPGWTPIGVADATGDQVADVLWRHASGGVALWQMGAGGVLANERWVGFMDPSWVAVEAGDYNGDGANDILWRHSGGAVAEWLLSDGSIALARGLGSFDAGWQVM